MNEYEEGIQLQDAETGEPITEIERVMKKNRREAEAQAEAQRLRDPDALIRAVNEKKKKNAIMEAERRAAARDAFVHDDGVFIKMVTTKPVTIKVEDPAEPKQPERQPIPWDYIKGMMFSAAICVIVVLVLFGVA